MTDTTWGVVGGKPAKWHELCTARGDGRVQSMVDYFERGLKLAWAAFGDDAADAKVLKVAVWPEWNFRAAQDEDPLSVAEYQSIITKITAIVSRAPYRSHSLIIPGSIFFGEPIVKSPTASTFTVTQSKVADVGDDYCQGRMTTALPGKWAMFNALPKWGNGVLRDTHTKLGLADYLDHARMVWGPCIRKAVQVGAISIGNDWSAVPVSQPRRVSVTCVVDRPSLTLSPLHASA